jgi:uracil-DNA glycosylase
VAGTSRPNDLGGAAPTPTDGNPLHADLAALRPWRDLERDASGCTRCRLHTSRTKVVFGSGDTAADLMFVATAPNRHEDLQGAPLVGAAGNVLDNALREAGVHRDDCYLTHLNKCHPPDARAPSTDEIEACYPYLWEQIAHIRPRVIVTLGELPTAVLLRRRLPLDRVAGLRLDVFDGITLVPTQDPSDAVHGNATAVTQIRRDVATAKAVLDGRLATGKEALADVRARRDEDRS